MNPAGRGPDNRGSQNPLLTGKAPMKPNHSSPWKSLFGGRGLYIALAVCLLAVGAVGYFTVLRPEKTPPTQQAMIPETVEQPEETTPTAPAAATAKPETATAAPAAPEVSAPQTAAPHIIDPINGQTVAAFSMDELLYDETMADWRTHNGVDISADEGAPVKAAADGTVASVKNDELMGVTVTIKHTDGYQTVYANLQEKPPVAEGQEVAAGDVIGYVGTTSQAEAKMAPHLHFSVLKDGDVIDPADFLN